MTRPSGAILNKHAGTCALVLDGDEVKARLMAERIETKAPVHVDWVRFTVLLRRTDVLGVETPSTPDVFDPSFDVEPWSVREIEQYNERRARLVRYLHDLPDADQAPAAQAFALAQQVASILGADFSVCPDIKKGHDFYKHRYSIERAGTECGWVGFLASGDSPRQRAQSETLHCNLYGSACTFADHGWRDHLATLVDDVQGKLTRVDLALDFFDGLQGGMERVKADYEAGLCDVYGKRPKCNLVGDWCSGKGRSFYVGSKEAGKQTNLYEKGHQLFGLDDQSGWVRAELRYGNKLRFLSTDMLRNPQNYFAGASDWHAALLREAESRAVPVGVPVEKELQAQTITAEVSRNLKWLRDVAGNSLALAFQWLPESDFMELVTGRDMPGRLRRFKRDELQAHYSARIVTSRLDALATHSCS